jgi:hypothetical protein
MTAVRKAESTVANWVDNWVVTKVALMVGH